MHVPKKTQKGVLKCAIGLHIADADYTKTMEEECARAIFNLFPAVREAFEAKYGELNAPDKDWLNRVQQELHDGPASMSLRFSDCDLNAISAKLLEGREW